VQVDFGTGERLDDFIEAVGPVEFFDLGLEFEPVEDVTGDFREPLDIGDQIPGDMRSVA